MPLAKSLVLHESALEKIHLFEREKKFAGAFDKKGLEYKIQEIKEGKPFSGEEWIHYLTRRCWELTESIYAIQIKNADNPPIHNVEIKIERLKSHLETVRTLLGKVDTKVIVYLNSNVGYVEIAATSRK